MKIVLPTPGRTRNALGIQDEQVVFLKAWKQGRHPMPANLLQGPRGRIDVLQCFMASIFIDSLDRIISGDEFLSRADPLLASAVFFSSPALQSFDGSPRRNSL